MSTRALIVVAGKTNCVSHIELNQFIRLYRHGDGYPSNMFGEFVQATFAAQEFLSGNPEFTINTIPPQTFAAYLMAQSIGRNGFQDVFDYSPTVEGADYLITTEHKKLPTTFFGEQDDIEWTYLINLNNGSIKTFDGNPNRGAKKTNPLYEVRTIKEEYKEAHYATIGAHADKLMELGWNLIGFNPFWSYKRRQPSTSTS